MASASKNTADILVIGAGVAGLSTALQLAARGQRVVVLEKAELGSGATSRASGLLGQLRSSTEATRMLMESIAILQQLQEQAGRQIFTQSGSVRIASTEARAAEIRQAIETGRATGLAVEPMDAQELQRRMPYMRTDDVIAACFCPTDGYLHPPELAELYIQVARQNGVDLRPHTPVEQIVVQDGKVVGCRAAGERVSAPVVVNAGGPWSHLVAGLAEQRLPTAGIAHLYFTVGPGPDCPVDPLSPSARDRENRIYSRPTREGALHIGIYEAEPVLYDMAALPGSFRMSAMATPRDHPTVQALWKAARFRFPFLREDTPMRITTGIMSWSPDGNSLCGEMPDVNGFYHCAGFCGHGVMQSAVIGVLMAELILDGKCRYNLDEIAADRYYDFPEFADRAHVEARCREAYATAYGKVEAGTSRWGEDVAEQQPGEPCLPRRTPSKR
jgi:glycine/D-amino acid oxidase-like deaminating enzyme